MKSFISCIAVVFLFAVSAFAQTPTGNDGQPLFSISTQAVAINLGGETTPGTDAVAQFNLTKNVILQSDNILAPGNNFQGYFGGVRYNFDLSKVIAKTNIPKDTFLPYAHVALGVVRNVPATGEGSQHIGALVDGGFDYDPTGAGHFSIGPRVGWLRAEGFGPSPNGVFVSANLNFVLGHK